MNLVDDVKVGSTVVHRVKIVLVLIQVFLATSLKGVCGSDTLDLREAATEGASFSLSLM